jgi:hypothetical protein
MLVAIYLVLGLLSLNVSVLFLEQFVSVFISGNFVLFFLFGPHIVASFL